VSPLAYYTNSLHGGSLFAMSSSPLDEPILLADKDA
jgi:hypothetical protein